jgi:hypothetical protein
MKLPSVKTIETLLSIEREKALRIRSFLEDYRDGKTCNPRMALVRVDAVIKGHGVEHICSKQDTMREFNGLEYVNMGDPFKPTIYFDHRAGCFHVGSWGDVVQAHDYRFGE